MRRFVYFNPHPKGLTTGDCVKRAMVKALEVDYLDAKRLLMKSKRELRLQAPLNCLTNVQHTFNNLLGLSKLRVDQGGYPVRLFNKPGRWMVLTKQHLVAVVDGVIWDTWDCGNEIVRTAWQVEDGTKEIISKKLKKEVLDDD